MRRYRSTLVLALGMLACHKKAAPPAPVPSVEVITADVLKDQAFRDLQTDVQLLKAQLAALMASPARPLVRIKTIIYLCDRIAVATRELADEARAQAQLGEADALCAYQVPLVAGQQKLAALETTPKPSTPDCAAVRDTLARIGAKYRNDQKLAELVKRFKTDCPRMRLFASARIERASAPSGPDPSAQRDACRRRCDDAAFDCRSRCQYCGSCTTDKTWEWCNATCNNCRQGCEQNERFCQASCGS